MPDDKPDKMRYIVRKSSTAGLHGGSGQPQFLYGGWKRIPGQVPGVSQIAAEKLIIDAELGALPHSFNVVDKMMDYPVETIDAIYKDLGLGPAQEDKLHSLLRAELEGATKESQVASALFQQLKFSTFPPAVRQMIMANARKYFKYKASEEAPTGADRYEVRLNKAEADETGALRHVLKLGDK